MCSFSGSRGSLTSSSVRCGPPAITHCVWVTILPRLLWVPTNAEAQSTIPICRECNIHKTKVIEIRGDALYSQLADGRRDEGSLNAEPLQGKPTLLCYLRTRKETFWMWFVVEGSYNCFWRKRFLTSTMPQTFLQVTGSCHGLQHIWSPMNLSSGEADQCL